jgi:hypothetical protein
MLAFYAVTASAVFCSLSAYALIDPTAPPVTPRSRLVKAALSTLCITEAFGDFGLARILFEQVSAVAPILQVHMLPIQSCVHRTGTGWCAQHNVPRARRLQSGNHSDLVSKCRSRTSKSSDSIPVLLDQ